MANCDKELLRQVRGLKPKLEHWEVAPEQQVAFAADSAAWQGYAAIGVGPAAGVLNRPFAAGERFLLADNFDDLEQVGAIGGTDDGQAERTHHFAEPSLLGGHPGFHGLLRGGRGAVGAVVRR